MNVVYSYYNIFAIPFLHIKIQEWDKKKKKLLELCDKENFTFEKVGTVKNSFSMDETKSLELSEIIENLLMPEINAFNEVFKVKQSKIIQSWFQIEEKFMNHPIHNHGYGHFSSVCYIEFDKDNHLPTTFISPAPDVLSGDISNFVPEDITEGSIVFFPSGLPHYSPGNTTEINRKILSFNIEPIEYLT